MTSITANQDIDDLKMAQTAHMKITEDVKGMSLFLKSQNTNFRVVVHPSHYKIPNLPTTPTENSDQQS